MELDKLDSRRAGIESEIAELRLNHIIKDLKTYGLPSDNYIEHSAMILEYDEEHEQARWVSHIILPEITKGVVFRSNDFRVDPKIKSNTAVQADYFLTDTLANGEVEYDGFGYDRGHLAPSADFRWNAKALSESYYYSNISPQLPAFNQESWAELENHLRKYVISHQTALVVVTAPLLESNLPKVTRSINEVSIPSKFGKAIYDQKNKRMIAFIMDQYNHGKHLDLYAVSVDKFEEVFGIDVFTNVDESLEIKIDKNDWFVNLNDGDSDPIEFQFLPKHHHNTLSAQNQMGEMIGVCGKVVASRYSRKGHLWLNLDRQYPNQLFSIFIRKESLSNFPYDLKSYVANQSFCFYGKVESFGETPHILLKDEKDLKIFHPSSR